MKTLAMMMGAWLAFTAAAVAGVLEFRVVAKPNEDFAIELPLGEEMLKLGEPTNLGVADVAKASDGKEVDGSVVLFIEFTKDGAKKFEEITQNNLGKRLAIVVSGKVLIAPYIHGPISGGKCNVSGGFTQDEAHALAEAINDAAAKAAKPKSDQ